MAVAVAVAVSGGVAVPVAVPVAVSVAVPVAGLTKRFFSQKDFLIKNNKFFKRPKNHEDGSKFDDFWTKSIASAQAKL